MRASATRVRNPAGMVLPGDDEKAHRQLSGGWVSADENGNLLRVRCQIIDDAPCGVDMLLRFTGTCLTVQARKSSDPATNAYEGVASGYVEGYADAP